MSSNKIAKRIIKTCPSCGRTFECLETRQKKYCSADCNKNRNETYMDYCCDECGTLIKIKKKLYEDKINGKRKKIFCSTECANKSKQTGHDIVCDNCGKVFYRRQYHIDRQSKKHQNNFCSQKCQKEYMHKQRFETRHCEVCGCVFEASKLSTQRFCSDECQHKWQTTRVGELSARFKSVLVPCCYCGTEHYVKPYKFNEQDNFFCSTKCRQAWFADVFSQSDEFKKFSREKMLKQLQFQTYITDTFPQKEVNELLDILNIEYKREESFEFFAVDNYLILYNLIIEVNGDYWHTNPTRFTSNVTKIQYDRIGRDKAKHSYFKNQHNIEILYLWEHDVIYNKDVCRQLIELYVNNNGVLPNYHSFNYILNDNILTLKQDVVLPYQDMPVEQYKSILQVVS